MQSPNSFFVEVHYYAGGLTVAPGGNVSRPLWAPNSDLVGLKDEFTIGDGDLAIEFRRILAGGQKVSWIGCYTKSVDATFGDRNNYAGIGVWTLDQTVIHAAHLISSLAALASIISKEGLSERANQEITKFLNGYLPGYFSPSDALPPGFVGMPYGTGALCGTSIFRTERLAGPSAYEGAGAALINASQAVNPLTPESRLLILMERDGVQSVDANALVRLPSTFKLLTDVVAASGEAWKASKAEFESNRAKIQTLTISVGEHAATITRREAELKSLRADLDVAAEANRTLKAKLDDLSNSPEINLARALSEILGKLNTLIAQQQRWTTKNPDPPRSPTGTSNDNRGRVSVEANESLGPLFWVVSGAGVLMIVAAVGYGVSKYFW